MEKLHDNHMKALIVRAPLNYGIEIVKIPEPPEGGLLLKILACALCGSDLRTLRSGHPKVAFPWTIGHEICGVVTTLGNNYSGEWQIGDILAVAPLVFCGVCEFCRDGRFELCNNYSEIGQAWQGGFAEYMSVPKEVIQNGVIHQVSSEVDPAFAAISEPISSCLNAQEKGAVGLGDSVVIIGSGPIGSIHTYIAHLRGANKVIVADISEDRLNLVESFAPDAIINASKVDLVQEVRNLTNGMGSDVVITANPVPETQIQAVQMARKGGRILIFGGLPADKSKPGIDMNVVHYNALHIIGTTIFAPRHHHQALEIVTKGRFPIEQLISRFPLKDFSRGAELALKGKILKAVFEP